MTDHRAEAEELLRHRSVSLAWPHIALHAIDLLADRLPRTPPSSGRWHLTSSDPTRRPDTED